MTTDTTMPDGHWTFDASVTDAFDDMLERSIPAYNVMRDLTTSLAVAHLQPGTALVDLGCSRGQAIGHVLDRLDHDTPNWRRAAVDGTRFVGVDVSVPMLNAARQRFAGNRLVDIRPCDLRTSYPDEMASVTLAVLTVQFTPIEHRLRILQNAYNHTVPGGALLIVEKLLGESAELHDVYDREYLRMKAAHGYTQEAIVRKKASLEGVLVSTSARYLQHMLEGVGFRYVDAYYRWLNFGGWVAVR
jgi:tRNA (cmo5U34)-methyltransferase